MGALEGNSTPRAALNDEMRQSARAGEPDRYLAALLAPRAVRDDLIVLAAFVAELKRIPQIVSDPHLAEIRLAWWRDALLSTDRHASGHATADAMRGIMARHGLDADALGAWLDAFAHSFYAAAPEDEAHLDLEHSLIEGTPFGFAARILMGAQLSEAATSACNVAGIAYGLARLGLDFPRVLARGRMPLPGLDMVDGETRGLNADALRVRLRALGMERLQHLKPVFAGLDSSTRNALLPVALVEPYLRASCDQGHDLTKELAEVSPLARVWRIWRASKSGHI